MGAILLNWKNGCKPRIVAWAEHWLRREENRLCRQGKCWSEWSYPGRSSATGCLGTDLLIQHT